MFHSLEQRVLLTIPVSGGIATINGTEGNDVLEIIVSSGILQLRNNAGTVIDSVLWRIDSQYSSWTGRPSHSRQHATSRPIACSSMSTSGRCRSTRSLSMSREALSPVSVPIEVDQITAALGCEADGTTQEIQCTEPGVRDVSDYRDLLDRLTAITRVLSIGVLSIAVIMLASAIALVANTLRMGMFARRKEIGIMRLVGATNWRIRVPFLIEGLVESLIGAVAALAALFVIKVFFIDQLRGELQFFPLIRNSDVLAVAPWILIAAVAVAVIAGTIGMRRFLDV